MTTLADKGSHYYHVSVIRLIAHNVAVNVPDVSVS